MAPAPRRASQGAIAACLFAIAPLTFAQAPSPDRVILNQNPSQSEIKPCITGTDFTTYRVSKVTVEDPFTFLYWIRKKRDDVERILQGKLINQPFTTASVISDGLATIEQSAFAPNNNLAVTIRVEFVYLQNCDPTAKTLEVIYKVFSTDPLKYLGGAFESQGRAERSPQTTTGLADAGKPLYFIPKGGYDRSNGLYGGAGFAFIPRQGRLGPIQFLNVAGWGSGTMHNFSAGLGGSYSGKGPIQQTEWRLDYQNSSLPGSDGLRLKQAGLSGQLTAASRPLQNGNLQVRFGGRLLGGNMQGSAPGALLSQQTVRNAGFGSLRTYIGVSSRIRNNVLSASYGLELGSIGPSARVDWRKHIGDIADQCWFRVGDHKPLEVETRLSIGGIQVPHAIPLSARFFGGSGDSSFTSGDSWQIRDAPVIRAIPANRFYRTGQGAGGDRFTSFNLTAAYPLKSKAILPRDLSTDPQFNSLLNGQITTAASAEQNYYSWKDPHFLAAFNQLDQLRKDLSGVQVATEAAQASHTGVFADEFATCLTNIGVAQFYVQDSLGAKGSKQYGGVSSLLQDDDGLQAALDGCVGDGSVNAQIHDPAIAKAADTLTKAKARLMEAFNSIDQKLAEHKASNDISFVRRTLNTLFKDVNYFSASPVGVLDAAWIGPAKGPLGGTRFGPGAGIRFELASSVNFTLGYAWNVNGQRTEGSGALFFSIGLRELFH